MDIEALRRYCLQFPHTTENVQWGYDLCFKVDGKLFLVTPLEPAPVRLSFKCSPENFAEVAKRYGEAFALYQRGSFAEAACLFSALAPDDPPSRVLAARCTMFARQVPGEWAGIFKMETK